jgi:hypothetical protein
MHYVFGIGGGALLMVAPLFGAVDRGGPRSYRWASAALAVASLASGTAALSGIKGSRKGVWQRAFQASSHTWQIATVAHLLTTGAPTPAGRAPEGANAIP